MRFKRIVHFDLGRIAVARDRLARAIGEQQRHHEVVLADEHALQFLAAGESDSDRGRIRVFTPASTEAPTQRP